MRPIQLTVAIALLAVLGFADLSSQSRPATAVAPAKAVERALAFLATLDADQRVKVSLPLNATTRTVWSNLPSGIQMQVGATERNGLKLGAMTPAQQAAALALLEGALSPAGYQKVLSIVDADQRLEETEGPKRQATSRVRFGRAEYFIALLGAPNAAGKWMLQFGGHHLAINVTLAGRDAVLTPSHTGAQPATFSLNGKTVRPLGRENDKAFALVTALDSGQQKQAVLAYEVRNLVLGPGEDGKTIQPEGLRASAMTAAQRRLLLDLVSEWVDIVDAASAAAKMKDVESHLDDTYFAWAGSTTNGQPAYFRIQGPTVIIEYAPQGPSNASTVDHIHTIYRDRANEYGARLSQ